MHQINPKITLPREIINITKVKEKELPAFIKKTIAIELFREGLVSIGKASEIAGLHRADMMALLASKKVPLHYSADDLKKDLA